METLPHIVISYPEGFQLESIRTSEIECEGLHLETKETESKVFACLEWAIPGLFVVFLSKSYFDSFLKEAGKDHYQILKKWLNKLIIETRQHKVHLVTSNFSPNKIDKRNTQSKTLSIYLQTPEGKRIKLLFDEELETEIWLKSLGNILDELEAAFETKSDYNFCSQTSFENKNSMIYAIIDKETFQWKFLSESDLARMHYLLTQKENNKKA